MPYSKNSSAYPTEFKTILQRIGQENATFVIEHTKPRSLQTKFYQYFMALRSDLRLAYKGETDEERRKELAELVGWANATEILSGRNSLTLRPRDLGSNLLANAKVIFPSGHEGVDDEAAASLERLQERIKESGNG